MRRVAPKPLRGAVALAVGALVALSFVACGSDSGDDAGGTTAADRPAAASDGPTAREVLEQEFPDIEEQNAAAVVRKFYDVLGKTPPAKAVGIGCIVGDRLYESNGDCEGFRKDEMAPEICRVLSKAAIERNFDELYPAGYGTTWRPGLVKDDEPKDYPQRLACLQGMGIFLRQVERDDGFDKAKRARITDAQVDGRSGTVTVAFPSGRTTKIPVVKEKGRWKFEELAGEVGKRGSAGSGSSSDPPPDLPLLPTS